MVFRIKSVCDEAGVPHPTIISESGRAVVAYHSLLVFDVLGVSNFDRYEVPPEVPADAPQQISDLFAIYRDLKKKNLLESYHDAVQAVDEALNMFNLGSLDIEMRALTERLFWAVCSKIAARSSARWTTCRRSCRAWRRCCRTPTSATSRSSSRCRTAGRSSSCSRSCRSIASTKRRRAAPCWATSPATRTARSTSSSTCATCATRCELHPFNGEPYYLGAFLLGAYQEILGDLHNLFGDTNAVHVSLDDDGEVNLDDVIKGDTVREVLAYVQYSADELTAELRKDVERAVRSGQDLAERIAAAVALLRVGAGGVYLPGRAIIVDCKGEPRVPVFARAEQVVGLLLAPRWCIVRVPSNREASYLSLVSSVRTLSTIAHAWSGV